MSTNGTSHRWRFFRAGGFDQVQLRSGADIANLDQLDQKLWLALACPVSGLEFDQKTLELIDTDKDGRIRAPEIIAAAKWACANLKNADDLLKAAPALPLAAINDATPEGKQLLASARQILANLGKSDASAITPDDTADTAKIFAQTQFNGDGIVPVDSAADDATKAVINDLIACLGAETDRSGKPGVNQAKVDAFFAELAAFSGWHKKSEDDAANLLPLGAATAEAAAAVSAVKAKVDDFFARCRLAAFDARAVAALNRQEAEYVTLTAKDLSANAGELAGFPLARIEAGRALPLKDGLNPAWAGAVAALADKAVKPLLGERTILTEADWLALQAKLAAHNGWAAGKAGAAVEKLGLPRVREILAGKAKDAISALIAKDKALEAEASGIAAVDKLARLHRDLYKLLINFVSFSEFYGRRDKAVFQVGTLYLDQRACDLCIRVEDAGRHAALAGLAKCYLAYCDCVRKATGEKLTIVAAFTNGDADNLMVGRNGVFYDRKGRDWDATITKIVDNPISIRQAFWSPYKKFVRMVEEQVAKRAAAAESASSAKLAAAAEATANADRSTAGKPPEPKKIDVGTVAALGVAVGAIGGALGAIATGLAKLNYWQIPLVIIGLVLTISLPSMIIAWLKLRQRNLGPILDANGWAVNAPAKINIPFGASLTKVGELPPGSELSLEADPFAEKRPPWGLYLFLILLGLLLTACYYIGWFDGWLVPFKTGK
jgi:hypothetical protein